MNGKNGAYTPPRIKMNKKAFGFLAALVVVGGLLIYFSVFFPTVFTAIINFFWIMMLIIVAVFLVLGILVIAGLKEEVGAFLDVLLEGSLTLIDAFDFLKKLYERFLVVLKDFIYFITPILAALVAFAIYIAILVMYKGIGIENDVTILTAVLTVAMVVAVAVLNRPVAVDEQIQTWIQAVRNRFKDNFADFFEIVIFVFFLTMDSVNLFFLPDNLNIPLRAQIGNFDLMLRAVNVSDQLTVTIYLVTIGIFLEIVRNIIRIIAIAMAYYKELPKVEAKIPNVKQSIRLSFSDAKDDLVKFIAFTTTLILVFLIFPRLKLFAMVITSLTGLILDGIIPGRLKIKEGTDLISRIINKVFNL